MQWTLMSRDTLWFKSFIIERQGERIEGKRERDRPWPRGEKGKGEREERLENKRERPRGRESKSERRGERRVRGVREQGGAKQPFLWYAVIFTVAR